jgi:hypothetical protein
MQTEQSSGPAVRLLESDPLEPRLLKYYWLAATESDRACDLRPSAAARTLSHCQARHGLVQVCHVAGLVLVERDRRGLSRHLVGGGDGRCCVRLLAGFEVGAVAADPRVLQHLGDRQALLGRLD